MWKICNELSLDYWLVSLQLYCQAEPETTEHMEDYTAFLIWWTLDPLESVKNPQDVPEYWILHWFGSHTYLKDI